MTLLLRVYARGSGDDDSHVRCEDRGFGMVEVA